MGKPEEPKPKEPKPEEPKPEESKPEKPKPEEPKPEEPKPEEPKPKEPKPEGPKPEGPIPEEPKTEKPKPEQPKPEEPDPREDASNTDETKYLGTEKLEDMSVDCSPSGISVKINECAFINQKIEISHVQIAKPGEKCIRKVVEGFLTFSLPTNSNCGTKVDHEETQIKYSNRLHAVTGHTHAPISRSRSIEIDFSCSIELDKMVSLKSGITPLHAKLTKIMLENKVGSFDVSMALFTDDTFTNEVDEESFFVNVPEPLFVGLELSDGDLVLTAEKCWATPSGNPEDEIRYAFIDNSCSNVEDSKTLDISSNGKGASVNFSLASFTFLDLPEAQLFIHCNVHLCDPAFDKCDPECSNARRRRRSTQTNLSSIVIGPVKVRNL